MRDLVGKVALVTGGGKGVGKEIARSLAERGADVIVNCFHSFAAANETKALLERETGARIEVIRASVAKKEQVDRLFAEIEQRYGGIDILVNNAASGSLGAVSSIRPEHFAKALDTNLLGSFWCAVAAAPLMSRRGGGIIVNVSSIGAGLVPDNYLVVGTSKAAVEALTRHLAAEFAPMNIRVNTASCSLITGDVAKLFPRADELVQVALACTPLGRVATPEDMVGVVTFLTSDLSRWVTGQVVLADGGLSLANAMLSPPRKRLPILPEDVSLTVGAPVPAAAPSTVTDGEQGLDDPIAVVGMGLAVPGANSPEEYWQLLMEGAELFVAAPADRWVSSAFCSPDKAAEDRAYQPRAGFITDFVPDPGLAAEIAAGDFVGDEHTTVWLRHSLHQALGTVRHGAAERVTFAVGYTPDGSQHLEEAVVLAGMSRRLADSDPVDNGSSVVLPAESFREIVAPRLRHGRGDAASYLPHEVARNAMAGLLPDDTQVFVVDTACSSSLYAIDIGVNRLRLNECDIAVCGGAFALAPRGAVLFSKLHGLSTSGVVRSLDRAADGVLFSDGAGVVVLKRLSRAVADGDAVLGIIRAVGSSSDGRGKAIYAPSPAGQSRAVARALSAAGVRPDDLDWVIAHATGTPAGDLAEFTTLRESLPGGRTIHVTSNKSLIGHTGWAAGVVAVIETLLALRHSTIPRQHRFDQPPTAFRLEETALDIPRQALPWPRRDDRPRTASVSGFGFGGTNAHVVVEDYIGQRRAAPELPFATDRVAVVDWSAHLPGLSGSPAVRDWLTGAGDPPERSFGDSYPAPAYQRTRIPPSTMRTLDRCQLMAMECMFELQDRLAAVFDRRRAKTGVLAGHMGPTRNGMGYALRCYVDPVRELLTDHAQGNAELLSAYERVAAEIKALVPPSNEDSFPGVMPNIIPARVANAFDLHGLNMTVDTGVAATLTAVAVASQYLRAGVLDIALVAGVNGSGNVELAEVLRDRLPAGTPIAEGAFMFVLMRESTAREHDLPILGFVGDHRVTSGVPAAANALVLDVSEPGRPTFLGADGAIGMLRAMLGNQSETTVACVEGAGRPVVSLRVVKPDMPVALPTTGSNGAAVADAVRRHVVSLRAEPVTPVRDPVAFVQPGTLVLTDAPVLLDPLGADSDLAVFSTSSLARPGPTRVHLPDVTPAAVRAALSALPERPRHIRLLTDLSTAADPGRGPLSRPDGLLTLHDLLFLTLQAAVDDLSEPAASVLLCLLGGLHRGRPHPVSGLFTGLLKAVAFELPEPLLAAVVTSTRDPAVGARQVETESVARRLLPVAVYDEGVRKRPHVEQVEPAPCTPRLTSDSVVLAVGGSRGITAEVLKALARDIQPTIYVLGSNPAEAVDLPATKQEYLRDALRTQPGLTVAEASRVYSRLAEGQAARRNVAEMARHNDGRVHYLVCDVRDAAAVEVAVHSVLDAEGRVDLLINAAGINRSGFLRTKNVDDFREVRDLKVDAYQNVKRAFGERQPTVWCNFSSLVGFRGQPGEVDYAAANDFLAAASAYAAGAPGSEEYAIGWNLWGDVGLGANPLMRSLLSRQFRFTPMSTEEGVHHFLRELGQPRREPFVLLMGDRELGELGLTPAQVAPEAEAPSRSPAAKGSFFLGRQISRSPGEVRFERVFDLDRDPYLADHVVSGLPTLPGTFLAEAAAEAAQALAPERIIVGLQDLTFHSFLRVRPGRAARKSIHARVLSIDDRQTLIEVMLMTDIVAPGGQVLAVDKPHFRAVVRMRDEPPQPPSWESWDPAQDGLRVPDPYHVRNPAVSLTGVFVATRDTRLHARGRRATYELRQSEADFALESFLLPSVLLDGLLRVAMLDEVADGYRALAAPTAIGRIDLYDRRNDVELQRTEPTIDLYSSPPGPFHEGLPPHNRCVAATPAGTVIARIDDATTAVVGYVQPETGDYVDTSSWLARGRRPLAVGRPGGR